MLLDSIRHAQDDIKQRSLIETQTEANLLIDTTENFLKKNSEYLEPSEIENAQSMISDLRYVLLSGDKDIIHTKIEALNEFTRPFAERVMDIAVSAAMKGKNLTKSHSA